MRRGKSTYQEFLESKPSARLELLEEELILDVAILLAEEMDRQSLSRAQLAEKLGRSRAHVTQLLAGRNLTLRTLAQVADALSCKPEITLKPEVLAGEVLRIPFHSKQASWRVTIRERSVPSKMGDVGSRVEIAA